MITEPKNPLATSPTLEIRKVYESEFGTIEKIYSWNGISLFQYYWCYSTALKHVTVLPYFSDSLRYLKAVFLFTKVWRLQIEATEKLTSSIIDSINATLKLNHQVVNLTNRQAGKSTLFLSFKTFIKNKILK